MSIKDVIYLTIPHEALYHNSLDPTGKMLLSLIAFRDMPGAGCRDSNADLASVLNVTERTVSRAITALKELGYIYVAAFDGRDRVLRIMPEYYDLLRGGQNSPRNSLDKLSRQPRQNGEAPGNMSRQPRQIVQATYKDEGRGINKKKRGIAPNGAGKPEPDETIPDDIMAEARAILEARTVGRPHAGTTAYNAMLQVEARRLMAEREAAP